MSALALATLLAARAALAATLWAFPLVDPARFARPDEGLTVVDRDGAPMRRVRSDGGVDRRWVPLREVPRVLVLAVLAAEDRRFFEHDGIDRLALARALGQDIVPGGAHSGASTITQQLVKRVYGRPYGLASKPLEMLRALALERVFTKQEILEQYLNRVPFGDGIEGVARASEALLGADVRSLSAAQAALLAGIPQAPSAHNPLRHPQAARARRDRVLARMRSLGYIDQGTYERSRLEPLATAESVVHPYLAPRYNDYVVSQWRAGALRRDGDRLRTSLSAPLQRVVERDLEAGQALFEARGATNAAALVVSAHDGAVLAYVGALHPERERGGGSMDLVRRSHRSSGSTLKPLAYGLWFERGASPGSVLEDIARPITGARGVELELNNYDLREHGLVTARTALASSYNLAALDVARRVGGEALYERLRSVGLPLAGDAAQYGAGLVLGTTVSPWELAQAYIVLARGGTTVPLIVGPERTVQTPRRAYDAASVQMVTDVLSDSATRASAFGATLGDLAGDAPFALKTGTSQRWRDAWAVTYDRRFVVVVWVGDPANRPMNGVSGFEAAAPIAARILGCARATLPGWPSALVEAVPEETVQLCPFTGLRAGPHCPHAALTHVARGHAPHETCDHHDADGTYVAPQHLRAWVDRTRPAGVRVAPANPHVDTTPEPSAAPVILAPTDGTRLLVEREGDSPELALRVRDPRGVRWFADGVALAAGATSWSPGLGVHALYAERGGLRSAVVTVRVGVAGRIAEGAPRP